MFLFCLLSYWKVFCRHSHTIVNGYGNGDGDDRIIDPNRVCRRCPLDAADGGAAC